MTTGVACPPVILQFFGNNGAPLAGGSILTQVGGVNTAVYSDSGLTTPLPNPVPLNSRGEVSTAAGASSKMFLTPNQIYSFTAYDANGNQIWMATYVNGVQVSQAVIGGLLWPQSLAEQNAGVVPVNEALAWGIVDRYQANTVPGTTNMDAGLAAAAAQNAQGGPPITLLAETYLTKGVSLRYNNAAIIGQGSALSTLKQDPSAFGTGGVVEVGNTALGNGAPNYDKFVARGFTIDGNRGSIGSPTDDLHGHGMPLTNITHFHISDVRAINCWNAGIGIFINSDYGYVDCYVENSSNATYTSAQFDINSSSYIDIHVVSNNSVDTGARILDNCYGITGSITVNNASVDGVVINDQSVNNSYDLNLDIAVNGGCSSLGVLFGTNVHSSNFRVTVNGVSGTGVQDAYAASNVCTGNNFSVNTYGSQATGVLVGGNGSNWTINSYLDARGGAAGSEWAVQVDGQQNNLIVNITDSATPQVRGLTLTSNSSNNNLVAYSHNATVQDYLDNGTTNRFTPRQLRANAGFDMSAVAVGTTLLGTITVTGAATGSGDICQLNTSVNIGGLTLYGEVTAANTVSVWAVNETGATQNAGNPRTVYALVTKAIP